MMKRLIGFLFIIYIISSNLTTVLGYNVLKYDIGKTEDDATKRSGGHYPLCTNERPTPVLNILDGRISFSNDSCDGYVNDTYCGSRQCYTEVDVDIANIGQNSVALSILLQYKCEKTRKMGVFQWGTVAMEIECHRGQNHTMIIHKNGKAFIFGLIEDVGNIHAIIEPHSKEGDFLPVVSINAFIQHERNLWQEKSKDQDSSRFSKITFNQKPTKGYSTESYVIGQFLGTALVADIIHRKQEKSDYYKEVWFMSQVLQAIPYPECLCNQNSTIGDMHAPSDNCSDGHERFSEIGQEALADGIWNVTYGFWRVPEDYKNIFLRLKYPAVVTKLEIFAKQQAMQIFRDGASTNNMLTLLSVQEDSSSDWKQVDGQLQKLVWEKVSGRKAVITRFLKIESSVDRNIIYEIIIHGWYLNTVTGPSSCFCFPGNGYHNETCDPCGQCKCRNENQTARAGKACRPYLSTISPPHGPVLGNISLTIYGGLLYHDLLASHEKTLVRLGKDDICKVMNHSDDRIICRVPQLRRARNLSSSEPVRVEIQVGGVLYPVKSNLNFTFRPDPVITNVESNKGFFSVKRNITFSARNLDSLAAGKYSKALHVRFNSSETKYGACTIMTAEEMICQMPHIQANTSELSAKTQVVINGFVLSSAAGTTWREYTFYETPRFHDFKQGDYHQDENLIELTGERLKVCCIMGDYRILVGRTRCEIFELQNTSIKCRLKQDRKEGSSLLIKVEVLDHTIVVGYLHFTTPGRTHVIIGIIIPIILIGGIALLIFYLRKRGLVQSLSVTRIERERRLQDEKLAVLDPCHLLDSFGLDIKSTIGNILIDIRNLDIFERIGQDTILADKAVVKEFLKEATIMKGFDHPNVLALIGVAIDNHDLYVILPFMSNGDLRSFLSAQTFNTMKFARFTLDVARGMEYLSDHKFVHRDLAARNCMVDEGERVYIGDFGLARDIYNKDYYRAEDKQKPLPFKWMALESLEDHTFSSQTDIWSLGIVMWEIFSRGAKPYPRVENFYLCDYLRSGRRLPQPTNCPNFMFNLMKLCWLANPDDRPTFKMLVREISKFTTPVNTSSTEYLQPVCHPSTSTNQVCAGPSGAGKGGTSVEPVADSDDDYETYENADATLEDSTNGNVEKGVDLPPPGEPDTSARTRLKKPGTLRKNDLQFLAEGHPCLALAALVKAENSKQKRRRQTWSFRSQPLQVQRPILKKTISHPAETPDRQQPGADTEVEMHSKYRTWSHGPRIVRTPSKTNDYVPYEPPRRLKRRPSFRCRSRTQSEGIIKQVSGEQMEFSDVKWREVSKSYRIRPERLSLFIKQDFETL